MKMIKRHGFLFVEAPRNLSGAVVVAEAPRGASELAGFLGTSVERIMDVSKRAAAIECEQEVAAQLAEDESRRVGISLRSTAAELAAGTECLSTDFADEHRFSEGFREDVAGGNGTAMGLGATGVNGKRGARRRRGAAARRRKYDPAVWGDLALLSDEDPKQSRRTEGRGVRAGRARTECFSQKIAKGTKGDGKFDPQIAPIIADFRTGDQRLVEQIQERVCGLFGISKGQLLGETGTRRGRAFAGRVASMALCRAHTGLTLGEIGRMHERCEHGAVSRATKRAALLREADGKFAELYARVEAEILSLAE